MVFSAKDAGFASGSKGLVTCCRSPVVCKDMALAQENPGLGGFLLATRALGIPLFDP